MKFIVYSGRRERGEWERDVERGRREGGVLFVVRHSDPGSSPPPKANKEVEKYLDLFLFVLLPFRLLEICLSSSAQFSAYRLMSSLVFCSQTSFGYHLC